MLLLTQPRGMTPLSSAARPLVARRASSTVSLTLLYSLFNNILIWPVNRIGPSGSTLYVANADGSDAVELLPNQTSPFDYHASWTSDDQWIVFTSERRAYGQSDLYRVKPDGSGLETLIATDYVEDAGALSPDNNILAYVSTSGNYTANIWTLDLRTGVAQNLTDTALTRSSNIWPTGHYRPSWSPDGAWLAFSSDRNTDWTGHSDGTGWEHTQTLGIYLIRADGTDFRLLVNESGYSLGSPQWSSDGTRIVYSNLTTEDTYYSHGVSEEQAIVASQIYSIDVATGTDIVAETTGDYLKVSPHYIGQSTNVGYCLKGGIPTEGISYTQPDSNSKDFNLTYLRNPSWSSDGRKVVYEVPDFTQFPGETELFSFDSDWEYRYMDVFPTFNIPSNRIAVTEKVLGGANGSVVTSSPEYTDLVEAFNSYDIYSIDNETEEVWLLEGQAGAFQPTFNPDGSELLVGFGAWFLTRTESNASVYKFPADGSSYTRMNLSTGTQNAGFPSWSPDGTAFVYRLWEMESGAPAGLRIFNFTTNEVSVLTQGWDNTPGWSPDGERIVFTRNDNWTAAYGSRWYDDRFDIFTIRPDGTDLNRVTDSLANDAQ
jgi:Tol biopolymer transport system component